MGIDLDNLPRQQALLLLTSFLDSEDSAGRLVSFVNLHNLAISMTDHSYAEALGRCALVLPDGVGLGLAARLSKAGRSQ